MGIFAVGGMIGALLSGWLADKIGRKGALLVNNVAAVIAAALMTSAKYVDVYYLITVGRFFIGFNSGNSFLSVLTVGFNNKILFWVILFWHNF